jgi:glyoxylate reductase
VIDANPHLRGIGIEGRYAETVDLTACDEAGIPLLTSERDNSRLYNKVCKTTADLTVVMVLCLAYRLVEADHYTRAGGFRQEQTMALMGIGCPDRSVGLIGLGKVARFMVPRLLAFELHLVYTKRTRLSLEEERAIELEWAPDKDAILRECDFVCVLVDYNLSTHLLIGERELKLMKPTHFCSTPVAAG